MPAATLPPSLASTGLQVTQEIGDTWIHGGFSFVPVIRGMSWNVVGASRGPPLQHTQDTNKTHTKHTPPGVAGVGTDPGRVSEFRALLRMRRAAPQLDEDPAFDAFSRMLLKIPEHTWGADVKKALADWGNWTNSKFHKQAGLGARLAPM